MLVQEQVLFKCPAFIQTFLLIASINWIANGRHVAKERCPVRDNLGGGKEPLHTCAQLSSG